MSNTLAMQYLQQDSFAAALHLLKKAEALAGRHKALLAITLNNLACYYRRRAQPKEALRYLLRALEIESKCRVRLRARVRVRLRVRLSPSPN